MNLMFAKNARNVTSILRLEMDAATVATRNVWKKECLVMVSRLVLWLVQFSIFTGQLYN